jgi:hypothetical protein
MAEFSEVIREMYDIKSDEDEAKILALCEQFGGHTSDPLDFADALNVLRRLGWRHESEDSHG